MVIVDAFTHYVAFNQEPHCNADYAYTTLHDQHTSINIPQSPTSIPLDISSSTLPETPLTASQQSTSNNPSDYLGSTPTSEQIRENPSKKPTTTERPPYWVTKKYPHGEPNLVSNPVDLSFLFPWNYNSDKSIMQRLFNMPIK